MGLHARGTLKFATFVDLLFTPCNYQIRAVSTKSVAREQRGRGPSRKRGRRCSVTVLKGWETGAGHVAVPRCPCLVSRGGEEMTTQGSLTVTVDVASPTFHLSHHLHL